jgi:uncharacterized protein
MADPPAFLHPGRDGVIIDVHVQPGARRSGLSGIHGETLKVVVREKARQGAANEAVCGLVAHALGVPKSSVEVLSGHRSRRKRLMVHGLDFPAAADLFDSLPAIGDESGSSA